MNDTSASVSSRAKQQITRTFAITTRRPVAIFMVVLAVAVFGYVSYQQLPLNMMPDISYPTITIRTEYSDTAPEEVENLISRPIEQRLGVVSNLVSITSISRAGFSDVILEFGWGTDMNDAVQTVRENLDRIRMPQGVNRPLILRYDPTQDPIMRVGLFGNADLYSLRQIAEDEVKQELEALKGVAAARVKGGLEEEIRVEVSERQIGLMGLGINDINNRLREENVNLAGGRLLDGQTQYLVRTLNEFQSLEEIEDLVVGERNGVEIRIKDVGRVVRTHKERDIITRVNGVESVEIEIFKEADANIVATAERVRDRLFGTPDQLKYVAELKAGKIEKAKDRREQVQQFVQLKEKTSFIAFSLPEGLQMELMSDQSTFIKSSVDEVKQTAVVGGILAILVLYVFLRNLLHTLIVGVAIPISIVATFAPMNIFGVSLNIMSLGGLALGIGMLVDNAIVVLESIFRCSEEGDDLITATVRGTGEVGGAVFASTLTTVAVFFPIVFVEGVAGQIFGDMALTVVFSLLASLGVALFFIPMLASRRVRLGKKAGPGAQDAKPDFLGEIVGSEILHLKSIRILKDAGAAHAEGRMGNMELAGRAALVLPILLGEFVLRVLWVLLSVVLVTLKAVAAIVATLLFWPFWAAVWAIRKILRRPGPGSIWTKFCMWCENQDLFGRDIIRVLWEDLLAFQSPRALGEDLPRAWRWTWGALKRSVRWVRKGGILKGALRALPALFSLLFLLLLFPLSLIYFVLRFKIFTLLALVGKLLILAIMLLCLAGAVILILLLVAVLPLLAPLLFTFEWVFDAVRKSYPPLLRWVLHNRVALVLTSVVLFGLCAFVLAPRLGTELIPQVHQGEFNVDVAMPVGTPLAATDATARQIETRILADPEVARIASAVGVDKTDISSSGRGEHTSEVTVIIKQGTDNQAGGLLGMWQSLRTLPARIWGGIRGESVLAQQEDRLLARLRERLDDLPQVKFDFSRPALFTFKTPIEVEVQGYDLGDLGRLGREAETVMAGIPGLYDVRSSLQRGSPEVQIVYNRDLLAKYNLNVRSVASLVREKVQGNAATRFRKADRRIDVLVRVGEADRAGVADLKRLVVNPNQPVPISLASVADIEVHEGPSEIRRIDQQRAVVISANVSGVDLGTATTLIGQALGRLEVPQDVTFVIGGQNAEMKTSMDSLNKALLLAIFLVYIVMASQFESFVHPFVIMFTIPLALIGVIATLYLIGISLSVVVFLGLIMLAGIVVNNAIVLVDYINHLRRDGMPKFEAICRPGRCASGPF